MLLPLRPSSLLLFALLGASAAAVAGPAAPGPQDSRGDLTRQQLREARQAQSRDEARQRPQRMVDLAQQEQPRPEPQRQQRRQRQEDALSDSVRRIERRTRGQVLSAERVPYEGRDINRIKVIDQHGRVRVYMDDPQQGAPTRGDDD